ncbi:MAG: hypothetical protein L0Y58_20085 [Verrucomicrobia subdivision 3 bacterium]|nr:hypothetical protein [Limisphaerales bacterium]
MSTPAFQLKPLSRDGIPAALDKAMRYRLLNEPGEAESICLDVLQIDPDNQHALVLLLLALTDRIGRGYAVGVTRAQDIIPRLQSEYDRAYYSGIIAERRAKGQLNQHAPGSGSDAYELLRDAMSHYEKAESLRPSGNDDALLRWNACARIIMRNKLSARDHEKNELPLE